MSDFKILQKWLDTQGTTLEGLVIYRLVWSDTIFEHRHGLFRDYVESTKVLIREVVETRLVRKYNYIHERWILEKWAPGNLTASPELPNATNGDYLPVYVFEDKKGNYLPPNEKSLKFIIDFMNGNVKKDQEVSQKVLEEKEIAYEVEKMDTHPYFSTHGVARDSVAFTKEIKDAKCL